jgi:cellulose biosynthesis protein BcsQ
MTEVVAFVGATGGAGTTRATVETAAALARDGRTVRILDAAYATQGLARYVEGRIEKDVTALCAGADSERESETTDNDLDPKTASHDLDCDTLGQVSVLPAHAPFERLARAKTTTAARRFERLCAECSEKVDHVLLDVPPVAANQHVAAVTTADRIVAVVPGDDRGTDALRQLRDRLADIGVETDAVLGVRTEVLPADATLPEIDVATTDPPAALGDDETAAAIIAAVETVLDTDTAVEIDTDGILDSVRERFDRAVGEAAEERASSHDGEKLSDIAADGSTELTAESLGESQAASSSEGSVTTSSSEASVVTTDPDADPLAEESE